MEIERRGLAGWRQERSRRDRRVRVLPALALAFLWGIAPAAAAQKGGKKPPPKAKPPAAEPPAEGGGTPETPGAEEGADPGHGPADGFGKNAKGGAGSAKDVAANFGAIVAAVKGGSAVRIAKGDVDAQFSQMKIGSHTTVDGGGCTMWFPGTNHNGIGVLVAGDDVVIRNLRVRNSGDNIALGSGASSPASNVLIENVSSTGSGDDGFSLAYRCHDITIRWSFEGGNTRAVFEKYGGTNVTMHHCIITHNWIRAPLVDGASAVIDFRNNLVQHWSMLGSHLGAGAKGNFVNNAYRFEAFAGGKSDCALQTLSGASMHAEGNVFEGCSARKLTQIPEVQAPAVPTEDAKTALAKILSDATGAGCMPRDEVDRAYLSAKQRCPGGDPAHGLQVPGSRLAK